MFAKRIVIEGMDRIGKFTQTNLLTENLRARGYSVKLVEVPFNDRVTYTVIYWMLQNGLAKTMPNLFQFIQFLNKFWAQILLLLCSFFYDVIVLDRWALSAIIYGHVGGANTAFNQVLCKMLMNPDLTIVLTGRAHIKGDEDVYERDDTFQGKVRILYQQWADSFGFLNAGCASVNANQSIEDVQKNIAEVVQKYLPKKRV